MLNACRLAGITITCSLSLEVEMRLPYPTPRLMDNPRAPQHGFANRAAGFNRLDSTAIPSAYPLNIRWPPVDSVREQKNPEARKMLENGDESHIPTARFVCPVLLLHVSFQYSL